MSCKRLFGVSNMVRILTEGVQPAQKDDTIKSLILEADARQRDPVYGSAGIITTLREEVAKLQEELVVAKEQLSFLVSQLHQQHQEHQQQHQQQEQQFFVFDPPQQQHPHVVHQPQMQVVPHHPHSQLLGDHAPPLNVMDSSLAPPEQPPLLLFQPGFLPMDFVQHQAEEAPQVKQERLDPEEQQLEQEFGGNFFQPANGEHRQQQEQQEHQQRHQ
ncbi:putative cyclin-dependent serine/threonine-protein kinase DDB_G0272797/DDB_G0274007 [Selaginella moellendorffii]|uniref:putative cyclin-dependent serine/threonine-protein kinase DDB_G0272797/DDB_G0274007 n=1 Tax=Selaginella moellendorffii TaxID=88036 RepID=UPI000D1C34E7|nr:putative cyclin-dependent serine/threonine-protein kinase DDB_G0272797/DDB_G0274007 [Selaginella moellendorffii]|eukprot:XP_024528143.1 putative cyclin-dependent serine/threonine-protein kinase DDB_G0272797/DDB_G0274007 [Selaginella moellendorffii]